MIGVPGQPIRSEGDDEIGLDVSDHTCDGLGAIVAVAVAVFVPEEMELVDIERGKAVAELDVPQRTELVWWPGFGSLVPCSPSVAVTTTTRSSRWRNSAIKPADV